MTRATADKHIGIVEPTSLPKPYTYTDSEEKAAMRCISNCNINCYFHSRMGCTIDTFHKVPQTRVGPQNHRGVYLPSTKHVKRSER